MPMRVAVFGRRNGQASMIVRRVGAIMAGAVRVGHIVGRVRARQVVVRLAMRKLEPGSGEAHEQGDEECRRAVDGGLAHAEN